MAVNRIQVRKGDQLIVALPNGEVVDIELYNEGYCFVDHRPAEGEDSLIGIPIKFDDEGGDSNAV